MSGFSDTSLLCALYGRVETESQARSGMLKVQRKLLQAYIKEQATIKPFPPWLIAGVYFEVSRTAESAWRPEFNRMHCDVKNGYINTVIVTQMDRIVKYPDNLVDMCQSFLDYHARFIAIKEKFDTSTPTCLALLKLVKTLSLRGVVHTERISWLSDLGLSPKLKRPCSTPKM